MNVGTREAGAKVHYVEQRVRQITPCCTSVSQVDVEGAGVIVIAPGRSLLFESLPVWVEVLEAS